MFMHTDPVVGTNAEPSAEALLPSAEKQEPVGPREKLALAATSRFLAYARNFRKSSMRIDLPHIGFVLSISPEPVKHFRELIDHIDTLDAAAATDPVIHRLSAALRSAVPATEADGIIADAIRLALAARWLRLASSPNGVADTFESEFPKALPKWRLKRVATYVGAHIGEAITLADLAETAGLSKMYFAAQFRAATGLRPHEYILRRRTEHAKAMLVETSAPLVEIALAVGFQTQAHFTTVFKRFTGTTPKRWRSRHHSPERIADDVEKSHCLIG